jgi:hypothetical protein
VGAGVGTGDEFEEAAVHIVRKVIYVTALEQFLKYFFDNAGAGVGVGIGFERRL